MTQAELEERPVLLYVTNIVQHRSRNTLAANERERERERESRNTLAANERAVSRNTLAANERGAALEQAFITY